MSDPTGGTWHKASRSQGANNCVEIGHLADGTAVRDTKNRDAGMLTTTATQWSAFLTAIKHGTFDT